MKKRGRAKRARSAWSRSRQRSVGEEIAAGLREAIAFERGKAAGAQFRAAPLSARSADAAPAPELSAHDVVSIRKRLGVSQAVFARLLNVSASTTRSWEQGINAPGGAASRLLQVAQSNPEALLRYVRPTRASRNGTAKGRPK